MKKELLALCVIAALPGCGCWRKDKNKAPKKDMTEKEIVIKKSVVTEKSTMPKKAKTHMDMQRY